MPLQNAFKAHINRIPGKSLLKKFPVLVLKRSWVLLKWCQLFSNRKKMQ